MVSRFEFRAVEGDTYLSIPLHTSTVSVILTVTAEFSYYNFTHAVPRHPTPYPCTVILIVGKGIQLFCYTPMMALTACNNYVVQGNHTAKFKVQLANRAVGIMNHDLGVVIARYYTYVCTILNVDLQLSTFSHIYEKESCVPMAWLMRRQDELCLTVPPILCVNGTLI